jgi:hypothetical protein
MRVASVMIFCDTMQLLDLIIPGMSNQMAPYQEDNTFSLITSTALTIPVLSPGYHADACLFDCQWKQRLITAVNLFISACSFLLHLYWL